MDLQSDNNVTTLLIKIQNTGQSEKSRAGQDYTKQAVVVIGISTALKCDHGKCIHVPQNAVFR